MKTKTARSETYATKRKKLLLEDNEEEDKFIRRLEKRLGMKRRRKVKKTDHPLWIKQCGFDYLLDFARDLEESTSQDPEKKILGSQSKKKRKNSDPYGQQSSVLHEETDILSAPSSPVSNTEFDDSDQNVPDNNLKDDPISMTSTDNADFSLRKTLRMWINRISETHMSKVVSEIAKIFSDHPRATVRTLLIDEVCTLLESAPVNMSSNTGWLQLDVAACLTCVHLCLHSKLQHDNLISFLVEHLVDKISDRNRSKLSANTLSSFSLFISYLYRFGIISSKLIFDLLAEFFKDASLSTVKAAHVICTAVGVFLRKADHAATQEVIRIATEQLTSHRGPEEIDLICEFEGAIQRLSEKHSKNQCVVRAMHMRKMMRSWTNGCSISDENCLSFGLKDIRERHNKGRWWLVGSASNPVATTSLKPLKPLQKLEVDEPLLTPEVQLAADNLGLRTSSRRYIFSILISTPGGPDATASALLRASSEGGHAGSSREREMVQIVLHCLMAEEPFNRFYPRVLGCFINTHRRFSMMIKCAFWDILKKSELTVNAKANAGKALGILVSVYNLPLTVLKNFNFGDTSAGNIAFLRSAIAELCTGEYQHVLSKLMQLSTYTHLSRNTRIFMRKHFTSETDEPLKALVLRLVQGMREAEPY